MPTSGVMVHLFVPKMCGTGLSVRYAGVPNKYSIVLTTAHEWFIVNFYFYILLLLM